MKKTRQAILNWFWNDDRVGRWLDDHLPTVGAIGFNWLVRRATAWGIPHQKLADAVRRARCWVYDGDGHHLTVVIRKAALYVECRPQDDKRWNTEDWHLISRDVKDPKQTRPEAAWPHSA
ncbi:MAG: hypothetical protein AAF970_01750 [Bacteroidota bacterium]